MASASYKTDRRGDATVLTFTGRVDLSNAKAARRAVLAALKRPGDLHVDLSETTYVDSSGIAHLVEGSQRARKAGKALKLVGASEQVRRVLRVSRLERELLAE